MKSRGEKKNKLECLLTDHNEKKSNKNCSEHWLFWRSFRAPTHKPWFKHVIYCNRIEHTGREAFATHAPRTAPSSRHSTNSRRLSVWSYRMRIIAIAELPDTIRNNAMTRRYTQNALKQKYTNNSNRISRYQNLRTAIKLKRSSSCSLPVW